MKEKVYQHIGYFDDKEDIIDLWPNEILKGDEADIVVKYWKDGYGSFHTIPEGDVFPESDFDNEISNGRSDITEDHRYIVGFQEGDWKALAKGWRHGFYIDIWEVVEDEEDQAIQELWEKAEALTDELKAVITEIERRTSNR